MATADVVVMDLRMPVLAGVTVTRQTCAAGPCPPGAGAGADDV